MMSSQRQFSVVCRVRGRRRQVKNCEDDARKTQQQYIYATVLSLNLVIYFTDPMDEYLMQYLMDYEDKEVPERVQGGPEAGQGLDAQGPQGVVQGADRLVEEGPGHRGHRLGEDQQPAAQHPLRGGHLQGSKYGWSSNMEKIMQAQTLSDTSKQAYMYQTALMENGFNLPDPKDFASSIYRSVQKSLDLSPDAAVEEEEEVEEPEVEEKESAKGEEPEHEHYDKDEL